MDDTDYSDHAEDFLDDMVNLLIWAIGIVGTIVVVSIGLWLKGF